eukprot:5968293-Pleurochrysis_carterae.AAC.1
MLVYTLAPAHAEADATTYNVADCKHNSAWITSKLTDPFKQRRAYVNGATQPTNVACYSDPRARALSEVFFRKSPLEA